MGDDVLPYKSKSSRDIYGCAICNNFTTDDLAELEAHLNIDRSATNNAEHVTITAENSYLCNLCEYKTPLKANFQLHCKVWISLSDLSHTIMKTSVRCAGALRDGRINSIYIYILRILFYYIILSTFHHQMCFNPNTCSINFLFRNLCPFEPLRPSSHYKLMQKSIVYQPSIPSCDRWCPFWSCFAAYVESSIRLN